MWSRYVDTSSYVTSVYSTIPNYSSTAVQLTRNRTEVTNNVNNFNNILHLDMPTRMHTGQMYVDMDLRNGTIGISL